MSRSSKASADLPQDSDFESLFETHPSPMWVYDPNDLRFMAVNQAAVSLYGYARESYLSMTVLDIRPESEKQHMRDAVALRNDIDQTKRWTHRKADGTLFDVLTYGREIRFKGQNAILAIVQDQSELDHARQAANDIRRLYDTIVDNLPIGVFVKDMQQGGRFVVFNAACGELIGYDPQEVLERTDELVFEGHNVSTSRRAEALTMQSGETVTFEESIRSRNGEARVLRTTKRPLPVSSDEQARYLLGIAQDITHEKVAADRLSYIAHHDGLTGLPNRAKFTDVLERRFKEVSGSGGLGLAYLDVDHFKTINDTWGHGAGDAVLLDIATRLRLHCCHGELTVRLGGDEFAILFSASTDDQAEALCSRLMKAFEAPFELEDRLLHVSCSVGTAIAYDPAAGSGSLLQNADFALYAAKEAGRNCFRHFKPEMRYHAEESAFLLSEMRFALTHDLSQFQVFFQPIVNLESGELSGYEALARWQHPTHGLIAPSKFIPLAEGSGLISALGNWVLIQACAAAATWPSHLTVAVNVSARQFEDCSLGAGVVAALDQSGLSPRQLEIEITESVFLRDADVSVPILQALKGLGVKIAIDDFGTGYSSLSYLRSFDFDKIKLDRSFLAGLETDARNLSIVRAAIGIGRGFGAEVVAEGVETAEQLELVTVEGFSHVQGFLFGRPERKPLIPSLSTKKNATC